MYVYVYIYIYSVYMFTLFVKRHYNLCKQNFEPPLRKAPSIFHHVDSNKMDFI